MLLARGMNRAARDPETEPFVGPLDSPSGHSPCASGSGVRRSQSTAPLAREVPDLSESRDILHIQP